MLETGPSGQLPPSQVGVGSHLSPVHFVGIDASGPANHDHTAICVLRADRDRLRYEDHARGLGDAALVARVAALAGPVVIGIDAPLSYGDRGGDRPSDKALRKRIQEVGLTGSSVMAPTSPRMVYLTLRGVALARALQLGAGDPRVVEVHPGAALAIGGAEPGRVRAVKSDPAARAVVLGWLAEAGLDGLPPDLAETDHEVMATAAAWAAWRWATGRSAWFWPAAPPCHPFDFAC